MGAASGAVLGGRERRGEIPTEGDPLSDTATYGGATFAGLGVTPGTYKWRWGTGPDQNFTLVAAIVPEPSTWAMMLLGLAGLVSWATPKTPGGGAVLRTRSSEEHAMGLGVRIAGAAAILMDLAAVPAQAGYVVDLTQSGSDVVAIGSGAIDLTGLRFDGNFANSAFIGPVIGAIFTAVPWQTPRPMTARPSPASGSRPEPTNGRGGPGRTRTSRSSPQPFPKPRHGP